MTDLNKPEEDTPEPDDFGVSAGLPAPFVPPNTNAQDPGTVSLPPVPEPNPMDSDVLAKALSYLVGKTVETVAIDHSNESLVITTEDGTLVLDVTVDNGAKWWGSWVEVTGAHGLASDNNTTITKSEETPKAFPEEAFSEDADEDPPIDDQEEDVKR